MAIGECTLTHGTWENTFFSDSVFLSYKKIEYIHKDRILSFVVLQSNDNEIYACHILLPQELQNSNNFLNSI